MNLKNYLTLVLATAAAASFAEVTTSTTLCRIEVTSGATNTIVALPLKTVNGMEATIDVSKLVMTDNLHNGDELMYWDTTTVAGGVWARWVLTAGAWAAQEVHYTVSGDDKVYTPDGTALACGKGLWLNRKGAGTNVADPFYLYGEVLSGSGATVAASLGTTAAPVYTLMGATGGNSLQVNKLVEKKTSGSFTDGDQILVSDNAGGKKTYTYKAAKSNFCYRAYDAVNHKIVWTEVDENTFTIPAGQGFWYVSVGGNPVFTL